VQYLHNDIDVNIKNENGLTALDLAAKQGTVIIIYSPHISNNI